MTGKIHVAVGTISLAMIAAKYPTGFELFGTTVYPLIGVLSAAAGSYAPDIDLQRSHSGAKHRTISTVVNKVGGGHRGITHTLLVPAIVAVLMWATVTYVTSIPYLSSVILSILFGWEFGYVAHLLADMFNGKGIPLFWPVAKGHIHFADFPSQGFLAWVWAFLFLGFVFFFTFKGVLL